MAHPRFLFTARVLPTPPATETRVAWRLVGGNNHELGRSHEGFDGLESCVAAVRRVQARIDDLTSVIISSDDATQRGWQLWLDDEIVAVSARWYRRERECEYNLAQFLACAPIAGITEVLGGQPPRRELLRPSFLLPHLSPSQPEPDDIVSELPDQLEDAAS
jgi:hypothetical protein